jgi:Fe-S oxidoreductase
MESGAAPSLEEFLDGQAARLASACTGCGRCVEVCPVVPYAGLDQATPADVVGGVLDTLRTGVALSGDSATWAHQCNGCSACIPACPESVNPRTLLMLANTADARSGGGAAPQLFR